MLFLAIVAPGFALVTAGATNFSESIITIAQHEINFSDSDLTMLRNDFNAALVAQNPAVMQGLPGIGEAYPHPSTQKLYRFLQSNVSRFSSPILLLFVGAILSALGIFSGTAIAVDLASRTFEERELSVASPLRTAIARHVWIILLLYILFLLFWNIDAVFSFIPGAAGEALAGLALFVQIYFLVRFSITVPALVSEELGPIGALARSWNLTRNSGWSVAGISIAIGIIGFVGIIFFAMVLSIIFSGLMADWNDILTKKQLTISWFLSILPNFFQSAAIETGLIFLVIIGFLSVFGTVLYYDLRTRVDGPLVYLEQE